MECVAVCWRRVWGCVLVECAGGVWSVVVECGAVCWWSVWLCGCVECAGGTNRQVITKYKTIDSRGSYVHCCSLRLSCQIPDYQSLDKLASSVDSILIVGGGFLGSELAVGLASRGEVGGGGASQQGELGGGGGGASQQG